VTGATGSSVTIAPVAPVTYPGAATVTVTAADAANAALDGTVELRVGDTVVASGPTSGGKASLTVTGLKPGSTSVVASFTPSATTYSSSTSAPVSIAVAKAGSQLSIKATKVKRAKKAKVTVALTVPNVKTGGSVVLTDKGRKIKTVWVPAGKARTLTVSLKKGTHQLRATYAGTDLVGASRSKTVKVKIG
jgi:hypothetical protein